jgi:hypothetical protein
MEIARDRICALPAQAHAFAPVLARVYRNGFTEEAEEFARRCDFKLRHRDVIGGDAHSMTRAGSAARSFKRLQPPDAMAIGLWRDFSLRAAKPMAALPKLVAYEAIEYKSKNPSERAAPAGGGLQECGLIRKSICQAAPLDAGRRHSAIGREGSIQAPLRFCDFLHRVSRLDYGQPWLWPPTITNL